MFKKQIYFVAMLLCLACQKDNETNFSCEVDYVEIIDATSARVAFVVTQDNVARNYIVERSYSLSNRNFSIGDQLVSLENFAIDGNEATFDFYYGENLGPFCADLFNAVPPHEHQAFSAEAEKILSGKGIGKWKIKQKRVLSQ